MKIAQVKDLGDTLFKTLCVQKRYLAEQQAPDAQPDSVVLAVFDALQASVWQQAFVAQQASASHAQAPPTSQAQPTSSHTQALHKHAGPQQLQHASFEVLNLAMPYGAATRPPTNARPKTNLAIIVKSPKLEC